MKHRRKRFNEDKLSMDQELEAMEENLVLCVCGHERFLHLDWDHEGPCYKLDCNCLKFKARIKQEF